MLGDVLPFAVEVGDLGRGRVAFRFDFELSRFEKSPKKPGAMNKILWIVERKEKIR
jgi:hypothetical protein